jgi:selenocysteine-specific elongation factor
MPLHEQILDVVANHAHGVATSAVCKRLGRTPQELGDAFEALVADGQILGFAGLWLSAKAFQSFSEEFLSNLSAFHQAQSGVVLADPSDKSLLGAWSLPLKSLDRMTSRLALEKKIYKSEKGVRVVDFRPVLPERTREFLNRVTEVLESESVNTPTPHRISQVLHVPPLAIEEILKVGVDAGEVVQLDETVFYTESQLERLRATLSSFDADDLSASVVRDRLATTRKYAVALLSYFHPRES